MRIGILDSGLGGLSVLKPLLSLAPSLECFYFADSAHCPYGEKSDQWIDQRCRYFLELFLQEDIEAVLIACNSATASGIEQWRKDFSFPIFGIEPFLNLEAKKPQYKGRAINLLTTKRTATSEKFLSLQKLRDPEKKIRVWQCPGLAELIESKRALAQKDLEIWGGLKSAPKGEVWILGCTHYPLISKELSLYLEGEMIDPAGYVAENIIRQLSFNKTEGKTVYLKSSGEDISDFAKNYLNPANDLQLTCLPWPQK